MFGRTGQTAARWFGGVFVGTLFLLGACVQLAGIDDPHPKPAVPDAGGSGGAGGEGNAGGAGASGGSGGSGGSPNVDKDAGPDAEADANDDGGPNPVEDPEWANWPMPHPVVTGLPNPADYSIDTGLGIVTDKVTTLVWQRTVDASMVTWVGAKNYCDGLSLGGFTDWRLPTAIELVSLIDFTIAEPGPTIDPIAFPGTPNDWFWTATPLVSPANNAWSVTFYTGETSYNDITTPRRVRCVR